MTSGLIQLALAVFGLSALAMALGKNPRLRKWAPIVGLLGQPFWLWFALRVDAWGLFAISLAYTGVYVFGVRTQWAGRAVA